MPQPAAAEQRLWVISNELPELDEAKIVSLASVYCSPAQLNKLNRFRMPYDKRNMLLSHLLQRHACIELGKIPPERVLIERTKGNKPFLAVEPAAHCPNFNFNPSHDGKYVLLAASTHFLVGADVHQMLTPDKSIAFLEDGYTPSQRQQAEQLSPSARRIWSQVHFSLKEAYTKALGVGLARAFTSIDFSPPLPVQMSNEPREGTICTWSCSVYHLEGGKCVFNGKWCVEVQWVDEDHIATIATGDVERVVDEHGGFRSRLLCPGMCPTTVEQGSCGPAQHLFLGDLHLQAPDGEDNGLVQPDLDSAGSHDEETLAMSPTSLRGVQLAVRKGEGLQDRIEGLQDRIAQLKAQAKAAAAAEDYKTAAELKKEWLVLEARVNADIMANRIIEIWQDLRLAAAEGRYREAALLKTERLVLEERLGSGKMFNEHDLEQRTKELQAELQTIQALEAADKGPQAETAVAGCSQTALLNETQQLKVTHRAAETGSS